MSTELREYKTIRINELTTTYKTNYVIITKYYNNLINNAMRSSSNDKQKLINNITSVCNSNLNDLKKKYDSDVSLINAFIPKNIQILKKSKAFLIGCNYLGSPNQLNGCINDANNIKDFLISIGFDNNNIQMITDNTVNKPTKKNILDAFKTLLMNTKAGDLVFWLFSGHGSYVKDSNGDEESGYDQCIYTLDGKFIIDDELKSLIQNYLHKDACLFALFDSCFSGSVLDLKYQYMDSLNYDKYFEHSKEDTTNGNVVMISGCNDRQTSADAFIDGKASGAMTWSFLESFKNNKNLTFRALVKSMCDKLKMNGYTQIPQLSTGGFVDIDKVVFLN
uniref:Peptidase C14 caspase domain-containing protein n=1 Tax=viral metagenome TaxID=1070528 RepID=A0A6C0IG83_9ZZZZ